MKYLFTLLIALFGFTQVGFTQAQNSSQTTQAQSSQTSLVAQEMSALRVAHLLNDSSAFTIMIDGQPFIENLASGSLSSYILLSPGEHSIELFQTNGQANVSNNNASNNSESSTTNDETNNDETANSESSATNDATNDEPRANETQEQETNTEAAPQGQSLVSRTISLEPGNFYSLLAFSTSSSDGSSQATSDQSQAPGSLTIEVSPAGAAITVTGPNGFTRELSESSTLDNLEAGSYVVAATLQGYQTSNQTAEVNPEEAATVNLNLQEVSDETEADQASTDQTAENTTPDETNTSSNSQETENSASSNQTDDTQQLSQNANVELKLVHDDLQVAPAGSALIKVIHASPNSAELNVVIAQAGSSETTGSEQAEVEAQNPNTENGDENQTTSEKNTEPSEQSAETSQTETDQTESSQSTSTVEGEQGSLNITVSPSQASNATITVTGPDDYTQELTGEGRLEGLKPGSYHVDATQLSYQPAAVEVQVEANSTAEANINLERLPEAGPVPIEGQNLFSNLAFETSSEYQIAPAGTFTMQLQQVDQDIQLAEVENFSLEPGGTYSLIIYDQGEQNGVALAIAVDVFTPQETQDDQTITNQTGSSETNNSSDSQSETD